MTDGGGFYHLSASPGTTVNQNYFRNTNGWLGLYFDEGSRYVSAANNVFDNTGHLGLHARSGRTTTPAT